MMKKEELIIGGWYKHKGQYCKVTEEVFSKDLNEFESIPMSVEILEKSGFKKELDKFDNIFFIDKTGQLVIQNGLTNRPSPYDWYIHIDNQDFETIGSLDFAYVHELQSILRLCGFSDNIEL